MPSYITCPHCDCQIDIEKAVYTDLKRIRRRTIGFWVVISIFFACIVGIPIALAGC